MASHPRPDPLLRLWSINSTSRVSTAKVSSRCECKKNPRKEPPKKSPSARSRGRCVDLTSHSHPHGPWLRRKLLVRDLKIYAKKSGTDPDLPHMQPASPSHIRHYQFITRIPAGGDHGRNVATSKKSSRRHDGHPSTSSQGEHETDWTPLGFEFTAFEMEWHMNGVAAGSLPEHSLKFRATVSLGLAGMMMMAAETFDGDEPCARSLFWKSKAETVTRPSPALPRPYQRKSRARQSALIALQAVMGFDTLLVVSECGTRRCHSRRVGHGVGVGEAMYPFPLCIFYPNSRTYRYPRHSLVPVTLV